MEQNLGAQRKVDRSRVPSALHELIPIVERWGFRLQEAQDDFVRRMKAYPEQIAEFNRRIDSARNEIISWGESLTELHRHKDEIDDAGWSHPYWAFLSALKVRELTEPDDSPLKLAGRAQFAEESRRYRFRACASQAAELFRTKDYRTFIEILKPFADLLDDMQRKKFAFAESRLESK